MTAKAIVLETPIMRECLVNLTAHPDWMFERNNVGVFRTMDGKRVVKIGNKGAADLTGVVDSIAVAVETKTVVGKTEEEQDKWAIKWRRAGGIYLVIRDPLTVVQRVRQAIAEKKDSN